MERKALEIPSIVWETLHAARIRLMIDEGYLEWAAKKLADVEMAGRKDAAEKEAPEVGLLSE